MGNKCKICGYRFKSKDEAICPECFTARDDDISCERYSAKEHSHGARSYSSGLRDTGESFVQQELRLERRNAFARENFGDRANAGLDLSDFNKRYDQTRFVRDDYNYDFSKEYRNIMAVSYPEQSTARQQSVYNGQKTQPQSAYQRFTAQQQNRQQSGFTPAGQIYAQRSMYRSNQPGIRPNQKKNSAGAAVFLLLFIIIFVAVIISNAIDEQNKNNNARNQTVQVRTTRTTTTTKARTSKHTTTAEAQTKVDTTMGNYNCEIIDMTTTQKKSSEINKDLLSHSTDFSKKEDPWTEVTIKVRIKQGPKYTDMQKDPTVVSTTLQCLEKASSYTSLSYSYIPVNKKIELTSDGTEIAFTLLGHKQSKLMYFGINIKGIGEKESCRFKITV